ncbi:unnamed protein product [Brachionus calyciflorus]|uniref:Uncharacterized protein n=1 Tax=Brachionus calyciflorus TaxID=104777 RepID=A0A814E0H8_9BILA|nr:unnamed protein product [Brachionus calyciflorus]
MSLSSDTDGKNLKKYQTFSNVIEDTSQTNDTHQLNRSNSLARDASPESTNHALLANNHNLSYGNNLVNLNCDNKNTNSLDSQNNCFKLHRSNEMENLADEQTHLKRTFELENLNEAVNDE